MRTVILIVALLWTASAHAEVCKGMKHWEGIVWGGDRRPLNEKKLAAAGRDCISETARVFPKQNDQEKRWEVL